MTGAICGGAPFLWKVERQEPIWCFEERKRLAGQWELRAGWEQGTVPDESVGYWEPIWVYRCDGCGHDRREFGGEALW